MKKIILFCAFFSVLIFAGTSCATSKSANPLLGAWVAEAQGEAIPQGASVTILLSSENLYVENRQDPDGNGQKYTNTFTYTRNTLTFGDKKYSYKLGKNNSELVLKSDDGNALIFHRATAELTPKEQLNGR